MDFFFLIRKTTRANIRYEVAYTVHPYATKIEKKQSKILKVSWKNQQNPPLITVCVEVCNGCNESCGDSQIRPVKHIAVFHIDWQLQTKILMVLPCIAN